MGPGDCKDMSGLEKKRAALRGLKKGFLELKLGFLFLEMRKGESAKKEEEETEADFMARLTAESISVPRGRELKRKRGLELQARATDGWLALEVNEERKRGRLLN